MRQILQYTCCLLLKLKVNSCQKLSSPLEHKEEGGGGGEWNVSKQMSVLIRKHWLNRMYKLIKSKCCVLQPVLRPAQSVRHYADEPTGCALHGPAPLRHRRGWGAGESLPRHPIPRIWENPMFAAGSGFHYIPLPHFLVLTKIHVTNSLCIDWYGQVM